MDIAPWSRPPRFRPRPQLTRRSAPLELAGWRQIVVFVGVVLLHFGIFFSAPWWLPDDGGGQAASDSPVRVRLTAPSESVLTQKPRTPPKKVADVAPKTSRTLTRATPAEPSSAQRRSVPQAQVEEVPPASELPPDSLPKESAPRARYGGLERFLPQGNLAFQQMQRRIGRQNASDDIAQDLERFKPILRGQNAVTRPRIETEVLNGVAYRLAISRRVGEVWGPQRMIPPSMEFHGTVGEIILYRVYVNRDGTLEYMRNVTADLQPWRDFAAIDYVVEQVLQRAFPVSPVPASIDEEPLLLELPIRWMGSARSLFAF